MTTFYFAISNHGECPMLNAAFGKDSYQLVLYKSLDGFRCKSAPFSEASLIVTIYPLKPLPIESDLAISASMFGLQIDAQALPYRFSRFRKLEVPVRTH